MPNMLFSESVAIFRAEDRVCFFPFILSVATQFRQSVKYFVDNIPYQSHRTNHFIRNTATSHLQLDQHRYLKTSAAQNEVDFSLPNRESGSGVQRSEQTDARTHEGLRERLLARAGIDLWGWNQDYASGICPCGSLFRRLFSRCLTKDIKRKWMSRG